VHVTVPDSFACRQTLCVWPGARVCS